MLKPNLAEITLSTLIRCNEKQIKIHHWVTWEKDDQEYITGPKETAGHFRQCQQVKKHFIAFLLKFHAVI